MPPPRLLSHLRLRLRFLPPHFLPRARHLSTPPNTTPPLSNPSSAFSRLPPRIQRLAAPLRTAPLTHITAFLILHEVTAVVPLGVVWWGIHWVNLNFGFRVGVDRDDGVEGEVGGVGERGGSDSDASDSIMNAAKRKWGEWVEGGEKRLGNYITKKGYLSNLSPRDAAQVVLELGTAWAVVKVLLPVRIVGCLWMTPWFARAVVGRVGGWWVGLVGRVRGR